MMTETRRERKQFPDEVTKVNQEEEWIETAITLVDGRERETSWR